MNDVRKAAAAGLFYPAEKKELQKQIRSLLENAKKTVGMPKAIIVPHAGYIYSGQIAAIGYKILQAAANVVIVGPSHFFGFHGSALSSAREWETPLGIVTVNNSYFSDAKSLVESDNAHKREHSIEVQVPFIQTVLPSAKIVPVATGIADPKDIARDIHAALGEKDLLVISTDLSHYYPYDVANKIDAIANKAIPALDIRTVNEEVEACGKTGVLACMHLARKRKWAGRLLGYANSGDTFGDKTNVVGYGCYAFE